MTELWIMAMFVMIFSHSVSLNESKNSYANHTLEDPKKIGKRLGKASKKTKKSLGKRLKKKKLGKALEETL